MKNLFVIFFFSFIFFACKKETETDGQPNSNPGDTNRWETVWQNESYHLISISFINKDTGYVLAFQDSILKQSILTTYDGGRTWINNICNLGVDTIFISKIFSAHGNILYFINRDTIYKSSDAGINWINLYSPRSFGSDFLYIIDNEYLLTTADYKDLIKSTDGGNSWNIVFESSVSWGLNLSDVYFVSKDIGFFVELYANGNNGMIGYLERTTDGCQTWETMKSDFINNVFGLNFVNKDTGYGYSIYEGNKEFNCLYRTTDGGISWHKVYSSVPTNSAQEWLDLFFVNTNTGYCHDFNKIYCTVDGGKTWKTDYKLKGQPVYVSINDWSFVKSGEAFAITDGGRIIKKMY